MNKNNTKHSYSMFIKVCIANLLLYTSLYTLLPVLPAIMHSISNSSSIQHAALLLFYFLGGVLLTGPFLSYIQDRFQHKNIAIFSYLGLSVTALLFTGVSHQWFPLLLVAYGVFSTLSTSIGITIAIDISPSELRNFGNKTITWTGSIGFLLGIILCCILFPTQSNFTLIYASASLPLIGILFLLTLKLHFRAPMGSGLLHLDRFLLPRGWPFIINSITLATVISCTIALFYHLASTTTPPALYFIFLISGYLSSAFVVFSFLQRISRRVFIQAFVGILCIGLSYPLFAIPEFPYLPNYLLGLGIGLIVPEFISLFVKVSTHCQRGTANTSQSISWEIGLTLGLIAYYYIQESEMETLQFILGTGGFSILFFLFISYPYFRRYQIRR